MFCFVRSRAYPGGRSDVPLRQWPGAVKILAVVAGLGAAAFLPLLPAQAQQGTAELFQNVRIFDGSGDTLSASSNVLLRGHKIENISPAAVTADAAQKLVTDS